MIQLIIMVCKDLAGSGGAAPRSQSFYKSENGSKMKNWNEKLGCYPCIFSGGCKESQGGAWILKGVLLSPRGVDTPPPHTPSKSATEFSDSIFNFNFNFNLYPVSSMTKFRKRGFKHCGCGQGGCGQGAGHIQGVHRVHVHPKMN